MKILMALDRRSFAGAPAAVVRKLRAEAIHMPTRDADAYMRAVVRRLHAEQQAEIAIEGSTLDERCESFLAGIIRSGMAFPVFQKEHVDASAVRVLRRARGLTQERLADALKVSFTTVNRWEAGEHLPANLESIRRELFAFFEQPDASAPAVSRPAFRGGTLRHARERARGSFAPKGGRSSATHTRHA